MRVRVTPHYSGGRKLTGQQRVSAPHLFGSVELENRKGRKVALLQNLRGGVPEVLGALFNPLLVAMHGNSFMISGVEKSAAGLWVHQTWECETGSVANPPGSQPPGY